ncbi:MAG: XRE family transcriptional regulator [Proteobacteria bacterium]|nr:XRE family transcriptional regulator [Pseudomonadota bacterium]
MSISPKEPKYLDSSHLLNRLSKKSLSFSALLEAIRLGEDATLTDFSKKLGISRSHLCDIEQGRKTVSPARRQPLQKSWVIRKSTLLLWLFKTLSRKMALTM